MACEACWMARREVQRGDGDRVRRRADIGDIQTAYTGVGPLERGATHDAAAVPGGTCRHVWPPLAPGRGGSMVVRCARACAKAVGTWRHPSGYTRPLECGMGGRYCGGARRANTAVPTSMSMSLMMTKGRWVVVASMSCRSLKKRGLKVCLGSGRRWLWRGAEGWADNGIGPTLWWSHLLACANAAWRRKRPMGQRVRHVA